MLKLIKKLFHFHRYTLQGCGYVDEFGGLRSNVWRECIGCGKTRSPRKSDDEEVRYIHKKLHNHYAGYIQTGVYDAIRN